WSLAYTIAAYFLFSWISKKGIRRLLIELRMANEEKGIDANMLKHKIVFTIVSFFMFISMFCNIGGISFFLNVCYELYMGIKDVEYILIVVLTYGSFCFALANGYFINCCHFILSEIKYFNKFILFDTDSITVDRLRLLLKTQIHLSNASAKANE